MEGGREGRGSDGVGGKVAAADIIHFVGCQDAIM